MAVKQSGCDPGASPPLLHYTFGKGRQRKTHYRDISARGYRNARQMKMSLTGIAIASNAVVSIAYLVLASTSWWIEPELADIPGARGGASVIWFIASCYSCGILLLLNIGFVAIHLYSHFKNRERRLGVAALTIPLLWIATVYIDFLHH